MYPPFDILLRQLSPYAPKERYESMVVLVFKWNSLSVFEGYLSMAQLERLKQELRGIMKEEEDSVIVYTFRTQKYFRREILGVEKGDPDSFVI